jgi:(S)-mandelate dehydrogenase
MSFFPRPAAKTDRNDPQRAFYKGRDLARAQTIADLRAMAMQRLPRFSAEYLEGGAEEEITMRRNRSAFDAQVFKPRVVRDVSQRDLSRVVLGQKRSLPFAIGPTGFNGLLWDQGDHALARAAAKAGIAFGQSTTSNRSVEAFGDIPNLAHWFQLYLFGDDTIFPQIIAAADRAQCEALIVTVDSPVLGNREWDRRNYRLGLDLSWSAKFDMLMHPGWMARILRQGFPPFPNLEPFIPAPDRNLFGVARWCAKHHRSAISWQNIATIRKLWPRKLIIKGVQHEDDLRMCIEAGADGVVLSNHGGRQLDRAVAPVELIAPARAVAGPNFTILVDSGFRRGTEIVQALALGADAVLLGRATLYGLAAGGEAGVTRAIEILATEIDRTIGMLGLTRVEDLSPAIFA